MTFIVSSATSFSFRDEVDDTCLALGRQDKRAYFNCFLAKTFLKQKIDTPKIIPQEKINNIQPPMVMLSPRLFATPGYLNHDGKHQEHQEQTQSGSQHIYTISNRDIFYKYDRKPLLPEPHA
jgi:hypothetical protein